MAIPAVTYSFVNGSTADGPQVTQNFTDLINGITDGTKTLTIAALNTAIITSTGAITATGFIPNSATVPVNGMYLSGASTIAFATSTTFGASLDSNQNWRVVGKTSAGGATISTTTAYDFGGTSTTTLLSGVSQQGMRVQLIGTTAATTAVIGFRVLVGNPAATVTNRTVGIFIDDHQNGGTITNAIGIAITQPTTGGTSNVALTDTTGPAAGSWFIYQAGTVASLFSGAVQIAAGTSAAPGLVFSAETGLGFSRDAGGSVKLTSANTTATRLYIDTTNGNNANAYVYLSTKSGGTGDAWIGFTEAGADATGWVIGRDDSDTSAFKIDQNGSGLGVGTTMMKISVAGVTTIGSTGASVGHVINGANIGVTNSNNTQTYIYCYNSSNGASSDAEYQAEVAGGTAGDAIYIAKVSSSNSWGWGLDNSASDAFVIAYNAAGSPALGTSNALSISTTLSVILNNAAVATTATDGFLYIASCAGAPTGVPTAATGRTALVYDTTNNKFYVYNGAWKGVTLS